MRLFVWKQSTKTIYHPLYTKLLFQKYISSTVMSGGDGGWLWVEQNVTHSLTYILYYFSKRCIIQLCQWIQFPKRNLLQHHCIAIFNLCIFYLLDDASFLMEIEWRLIQKILNYWNISGNNLLCIWFETCASKKLQIHGWIWYQYLCHHIAFREAFK